MRLSLFTQRNGNRLSPLSRGSQSSLTVNVSRNECAATDVAISVDNPPPFRRSERR